MTSNDPTSRKKTNHLNRWLLVQQSNEYRLNIRLDHRSVKDDPESDEFTNAASSSLVAVMYANVLQDHPPTWFRRSYGSLPFAIQSLKHWIHSGDHGPRGGGGMGLSGSFNRANI